MPRTAARTVLSVLAAAGVVACGNAATSTGSSSTSVGPAVGQMAPPVSGTSLQGHRVDAGAWRGSVVVVLFWASWCGPCQAEQPAVNALAASEQPKGVHFAGVSVDVDAAAARQYLVRYAVPYDSLIDDPAQQTFTLAFEISGPPQTFVIDGRGRVAARIVGPIDPAALRSDIDAARSVS